MENHFTQMMEAVVSLMERKQLSQIDKLVARSTKEPLVTQSESIKVLAKALPAAQKEFKRIKKSGYNTHYKSDYETLVDVYQAVLPALNKNGFSLRTELIKHEDGYYLQTKLMHESGEWTSTHFPVTLSNSQQANGTTFTYYTRYNLRALLCLSITNDPDEDDGETNRENLDERTVNDVQYKTQSSAAPYITKAQLELLEHTIGTYDDIATGIMEKFGIRRLADLQTDTFDGVMSAVQKRINLRQGKKS